MSDQPFRLDPAASFDAEVARIADEHGADLAFQLVDRGDRPMEPHKCELHDHTATLRAERYTFTITDPDGRVTQIVVCKEHGQWLHDRKPDRELPPGSNTRAQQLRPQLSNPGIKIEGGRRIREPEGRGPGGGPGGRSMVPEPPPPPQRPPERTYPTYGHDR